VKGYFNSVEELYEKRLERMLSVARKYIYNKDLALDVVHNALAKSIVYFQKHPDKKIQLQIVEFLIIKSCKKYNRYSPEMPSGHPMTEEERQGYDKEWMEGSKVDFDGQL
jgi:hypothetical protein